MIDPLSPEHKAAIAALERAICYGMCYGPRSGHKLSKAGEVIEKMRPEDREALKKLTAEDLALYRTPWIGP
jgi:hypothetical protein